ncbi:PTS sugar transporter subunit IIA [Enterococcus sp. 669A]|uniref:PTS sugar transporter subunit IIA n=1 Tax=Candidatus Enterococcus moelleringii TaxID=2815325 RepID=A0ABS3L5L8_9ENTE|nr:PTS sugar transporter subunit IIA [Enterococcus sp. 669A]MBO1304914.1 PTS sugar transporter subunit IIA [Enterococcus sp. 669A]
MDLASLMMNDLVIFDESIRSKDALFERLGQLLEENGRVTKAKKVVKDLYKREEETSTGIEDGFGIPHAKSKHVLKPTVCFVHTSQISDYKGLDDQPIECVFAILVPKKAADIHLDILSGLSRKLMNQAFRDQLKQAVSSEEVMEIIHGEE